MIHSFVSVVLGFYHELVRRLIFFALMGLQGSLSGDREGQHEIAR